MALGGGCCRRARCHLVRLASRRRLCTGHVGTVSPLPYERIPRLPSWPVVGSLPAVRFGGYSPIGRYHESLAAMRRRHGPLAVESRGFVGRDVLHVFEPADAKAVFTADGRTPHIVPLQETVRHYRQMKDMSLGLGNMNGDEWYRLRSAVQQAMMRPSAVQQYFHLVDQVASDFVQCLSEHSDSDHKVDTFKNLVSRWSFETSGLLVFERRLGALGAAGTAGWSLAGRMIDANRTMFDISGRLRFALPLWQYFATPKWRRLIKAEDVYYGEAGTLLDEAFGRMKRSADDDTMLFMNYLVSQAEHGHISMKDVRIIALSLFGDGLNTTAPMFIYNMYCVASSRRAQRRLRDEVLSLTDGGRDVTAAKLSSAAYLNACIKETFRLYPIGTEVSRVTQRDLMLAGYHVPKGTAVDINMAPYLVCEQHFGANASQYYPERWLRGHADYAGRKVHPFALLPFGHGTRMCAGRRFAEQDLRVAIARVLAAYTVQYCGEAPLQQEMRTLLLPRGKCVFRFVPH